MNAEDIGRTLPWRKQMASIPIYGRFVGDFTAHLVAVDTEDTIDAVAAKIAAHAVGKRLPEQPGAKGFEVLAAGRTLAPESRLKDIAPRPLQWLDVRWRW
jgi:toluene monooxygenase system protein B